MTPRAGVLTGWRIESHGSSKLGEELHPGFGWKGDISMARQQTQKASDSDFCLQNTATLEDCCSELHLV